MSFFTQHETELTEQFLRDGYIVHNIADTMMLSTLRKAVIESASSFLECDAPKSEDEESVFLNSIHQKVSIERLNDFRLQIYRDLNMHPWTRPNYYHIGKPVIDTIVGNELAMQNRVNVSIQMPGDTSSLIPIHSDFWSGETPFQIVQWLPLVDVSGTKSMFILPPDANKIAYARMYQIAEQDGVSALYTAVKDELKWVDVAYGQVLIFNPGLLHGNTVNETQETRWSFNCRFTGLFTPYPTQEKGLGSFYLPITPRAVSRSGMDYRPPQR